MHKIVLQKLYALSFLLMLPVVTFAQNNYKVEYSVEHSRDKETIDKFEADIIAAIIYFDEVVVGSHPFAEAVYLEKSSGLALAYLDAELISGNSGFDQNGILALVHYVLPKSEFIVDAGFIRTDGGINNGFNGGIDVNSIIVGFGAYLNANSSVMINYSKDDLEIDFAPGFLPVSKEKNTTFMLDYKLVKSLDAGKAFGVEASIASSEFKNDTTSEINTTMAFSGDYYLDQSISIGASIDLNSGDDKSDEGKAIGVNVNVFLVPAFSVYAEVIQFNADNALGEDSDEFIVGATARF